MRAWDPHYLYKQWKMCERELECYIFTRLERWSKKSGVTVAGSTHIIYPDAPKISRLYFQTPFSKERKTVNLHIRGPLWQTRWATISACCQAQLCHQGSNSLLPRQVASPSVEIPRASIGHFYKANPGLEMTWPLLRTFSGYISAPMIFWWRFYHYKLAIITTLKNPLFCDERNSWSCTVSVWCPQLLSKCWSR